MSFENNIPIYLQLVEKIRMQIVSGYFQPGERVLSVREWALKERVNPNTMRKALVELEAMGLLQTERTNGKFVTSDLDLILECKEREASRIALEFYCKMSQIGFDSDEALLYLKECERKKEEC